jgi:D-alanyl-D-alanine carboxypeptidase
MFSNANKLSDCLYGLFAPPRVVYHPAAMSRAARRAAGWMLALGAALLLSLALSTPFAVSERPALADARSPTPVASAPSSGVDGSALPPIPHWPPANPRAGAAAPGDFAPLDAADAEALRLATDRTRTRFGINVLAIGVVADSTRSWTGVSGLAGDGQTPLDGSSPFAIASITKTYTASVVLQLVEEGRLSLDEEATSLMPDAGLPPGVTVRQLLSHTSGIADLLAPMREAMNADLQRTWTGAEVIARLGAPWFAPGADYAYSNSNFVILGMLVERITGHAFTDELAARLLSPLGLDATGVLATDSAPPLMPPSWASAFGTSGDMYSSTGDLLTWAEALYGGFVLKPASLAAMLAFGEDDYGLGAQRISVGEYQGYGHSGLLRGFTSLMVRLPAQRVTLVVLGTWQGFEPAAVLTYAAQGSPSILDVALRAAGTLPAPTPTASAAAAVPVP